MNNKKGILNLEDLLLNEINILMIPPRNEDWTKFAIKISKNLPNSSIFYGVRNNKIPKYQEFIYKLINPHKNKQNENYPYLLIQKNSSIKPKSIKSRLDLKLYETFNKSKNSRIYPFNLRSYYEFPFNKNSFDLAITQTPNGSDVILFLAYGINHKPKALFNCMKKNSYWIHMTSSLDLKEEAYPFFELLNEGSPEIFENQILRNIFGKNGCRLSKSDEEILSRDRTRGELISGDNKWILYKTLTEKREELKKIE